MAKEAERRVLVDYHVHSLGHADFRHVPEEIRPFLEMAREGKIGELGLADHDRYIENFSWATVREVAQGYPQVKIRYGVEVDYHPGQEAEIRGSLAGLPLDFCLGSVHDIGEWNFDHPDYQDGFTQWDLDDLYRAYFSRVAACAASGIFQAIGHLDLIKIFGHRPKGDVVQLAREALEAIAKHGVAIEVSTAGLRKPVGEIYPSLPLLTEAFALGIPITLSSDAHVPGEVGFGLQKAAELVRQVGYRTVTVFSRRKPRQVEL